MMRLVGSSPRRKAGKCDREDDGFEMAGRHRRYQSLDFSIDHEFGRIRHGVDMPVRQEYVTGRYGLEDLHDEGRKILGQQQVEKFATSPQG